MHSITNISATIFDMDGTLIDSETLTAPAIDALCREHGIDGADLDCTQFYGVAWRDIERALKAHHPRLAGRSGLAERLHAIYHEMLAAAPPPLIPRSRESVVAASGLMPTAIVSSSGRASIQLTIGRLDIAHAIDFYAGAEDCEQPKPAPDGYLKAAATLGVPPGECLVFEDSIAGLQSARAAGMQLVAVTHRCTDPDLAGRIADAVITDYRDLDDDFFRRVKKGR